MSSSLLPRSEPELSSPAMDRKQKSQLSSPAMDRKQKSQLFRAESPDPRPASKIQRTSPRYGKICLFCFCAPNTDRSGFSYDPHRIDRCLYIFDLDAESSCSTSLRRRNPDLYFEARPLAIDSVCLLGSTLYLIKEMRRDVFSHDLTATTPHPSSSTNPQLLSNDQIIDPHCPMNFPKHRPLACQTPDRKKMIVFSGVLFVNDDDNRNFELFVPREGGGGEWKLLPELVPLLRKSWVKECRMGTVNGTCPFVRVQTYGFIGNGPDLLITTVVGKFTLNIEVGLGWKPWGEKFHVPRTEYETCVLVRDDLFFTDWFAWRVGDSPNRSLSYPNLFSLTYSDHGEGSGVIWLQGDFFCVARCIIEEDGTEIRLIIDVYKFDSGYNQSNRENIPVQDDREEEEMVVPGVEVVKRLQFVVDHQFKSMHNHFIIRSLFSIPPEEV